MGKIKKLVLSAMFMALGIVLPFLTMQIEGIGSALLPMHLPIMLTGLICGWKYGLAVGFITPLLRSVTVGMPRIYPDAVYMAFELATYGLVIGILYKITKKEVYTSLIGAMLAGRIVWGIIKACLLGVGENGITFALFITDGFVEALPGIALQLILIPMIMTFMNRFKLSKDCSHQDQ